MRDVLIGLLGAVSLLGAGCSAGSSTPAEGSVQREESIIGGTLDTTHQAVVGLYTEVNGQAGLCTGTIIGVSGNKGFVLTAAHCVADGAPQYVLMGNDIATQSTQAYQVTAAKAHPSYKGISQENFQYDFAMVTFVGASAGTPVIPVMTKETDNLKDGSAVTFVGYGRTSVSNPNAQNSKRYSVAGKLDDVYPLIVVYGQDNGGPCQGDSGGPSLSTVGGQELVSTVTSFGDENCTIDGYSGRVSAVYDSFIKPYMDGTSPVLTCDECVDSSTQAGACSGTADACFNDTACAALVQCLNGCQDNACGQACAQANQAGLTKYNAIFSCVCTSGCPTECGGEDFCKPAPAEGCGFSFAPPTFPAACDGCAESKCCDAQKNCVDDAACVACATGQSTTGCNTNTNLQALFACIDGTCGTECGASGAGGSGAGGSGQAGSGQAGSAQAGSGQAGSGQAGSAQAGSGQAGQG
ncbi:MAG: trypsin-like serine protease, partial [Myxococcaceae bacterium]